MPKTIILLCDGSWDYWNSLYPSNVRLLADIFQTQEHKKLLEKEIQIIYSDGFTLSESEWVKEFTGNLGHSVNKIIADLYCEICLAYNLGDSVTIFGNSRGAFIARSLIGFIRRYGLLKKELYRYSENEIMQNAKPLFEQYYQNNYRSTNTHTLPIKLDIMKAYAIQIDYLGILDTIAGMSEDRLRAHDVFLHNDMVLASCHLLATHIVHYYANLSYHTTSIEDGINRSFQVREGKHVEFRLPGNHGNVIGGYNKTPSRETCLANQALREILQHSPFRVLLVSNTFATNYPIFSHPSSSNCNNNNNNNSVLLRTASLRTNSFRNNSFRNSPSNSSSNNNNNNSSVKNSQKIVVEKRSSFTTQEQLIKSVLNPAHMPPGHECECMFFQVSQQIASKLGLLKANSQGAHQPPSSSFCLPFLWFRFTTNSNNSNNSNMRYKQIPVGMGYSGRNQAVFASDELQLAIAQLNEFQVDGQFSEEGIFLWSYLRSELEDLIFDGQFFALQLEDVSSLCQRVRTKHIESTTCRSPPQSMKSL